MKHRTSFSTQLVARSGLRVHVAPPLTQRRNVQQAAKRSRVARDNGDGVSSPSSHRALPGRDAPSPGTPHLRTTAIDQTASPGERLRFGPAVGGAVTLGYGLGVAARRDDVPSKGPMRDVWSRCRAGSRNPALGGKSRNSTGHPSGGYGRRYPKRACIPRSGQDRPTPPTSGMVRGEILRRPQGSAHETPDVILREPDNLTREVVVPGKDQHHTPRRQSCWAARGTTLASCHRSDYGLVLPHPSRRFAVPAQLFDSAGGVRGSRPGFEQVPLRERLSGRRLSFIAR